MGCKRKTLGGKTEVRREIEPELLAPEEQAEYTAELGRLRSEVKHIQAHASALNALIACEGRFMKPEQIREEIRRLQKTTDEAVARHQVLRLVA